MADTYVSGCFTFCCTNAEMALLRPLLALLAFFKQLLLLQYGHFGGKVSVGFV